MTVATLFNVPTTDEEMRQWSFSHMAHHRDINSAIQANFAIVLPLYVLDPVDMNHPSAFLDQHQLMHNNADQILGVAGFDLSEVNWADPQQRAGWIYLNATLHAQEASVLGVD